MTVFGKVIVHFRGRQEAFYSTGSERGLLLKPSVSVGFACSNDQLPLFFRIRKHSNDSPTWRLCFRINKQEFKARDKPWAGLPLKLQLFFLFYKQQYITSSQVFWRKCHWLIVLVAQLVTQQKLYSCFIPTYCECRLSTLMPIRLSLAAVWRGSSKQPGQSSSRLQGHNVNKMELHSNMCHSNYNKSNISKEVINYTRSNTF